MIDLNRLHKMKFCPGLLRCFIAWQQSLIIKGESGRAASIQLPRPGAPHATRELLVGRKLG